jgi:D-methionine transport system permease protein
MSLDLFPLLLSSTLETIYMVLTASLIAFLFGLPLGIWLFSSRENSLHPQPITHRVLGFVIDATRSTPFVILLIAIIPFTHLLIGTSIGTTAAIIPLSVAAIPFYARLVSNTLLEIPRGLVEAGRAMGATQLQIIHHILLPEARPALVANFTVMVINLVGYSAMAGVVGGGGLGDLAIRYGYQRFDVSIMFATVVILLVLVQLFEWGGHTIVRTVDHR